MTLITYIRRNWDSLWESWEVGLVLFYPISLAFIWRDYSDFFTLRNKNFCFLFFHGQIHFWHGIDLTGQLNFGCQLGAWYGIAFHVFLCEICLL